MNLEENIFYENTKVTKQQRALIKNQKPCVLWFTGLSGSGKSTIAITLEESLYKLGYHTYILDGDNIRLGINSDLNFKKKSREENIRRIGEISKLFTDAGLIVLVSAISPLKKSRKKIKNKIGNNEFIEIFVDTPLDICEARDTKGLYKKAKKGQIKNFTGISSPYQKPSNPNIHLKGYNCSIKNNINTILNYLRKNKYLT